MEEHTNTTLVLTNEQCQYLLQVWERITCTLVFDRQAKKMFQILKGACSVVNSDQARVNRVQNQLAQLFYGVSDTTIGQFQLYHFVNGISTALSTGDAGFVSVASSHQGEPKITLERIPILEVKLKKFIAHAVPALMQLVNNHWDDVAVGLKVQDLPGDPLSTNKQKRRVYHHLELLKLKEDAELHWLRRALALIRAQRDFKEYLQEKGHSASDTQNLRMRHAYLVENYAAGLSSSKLTINQIKSNFRDDLRYAGRWRTFISVLGYGALLVCGDAISKLVYKTAGNTNNDLKWLATEIKNCQTVDFQSLCDIFNLPTADILDFYRVKNQFDKVELLANISRIAGKQMYSELVWRSFE